MKKIMLVGKISAGKTTLCQYLNNEDLSYHKTQAVQVVGDCMIDTPGEYLELRHMYSALMVTSVEADVVVLVQDATDERNMFAPALNSMFAKPVIGVVTKSDIATDDDLKRATSFLEIAGAEKIFVTSSMQGTGFEDLYNYLNC